MNRPALWLIAGMQPALVRFFQATPRSPATPASMEPIFWEHRELFEAIRDRDVERARVMIRVQIRATLDLASELTHTTAATNQGD